MNSATSPAKSVDSPRQLWRLIAWISGVFCLLVGLTMLVGQLTTKSIDPLKSPELKVLKERLRQNPGDEPTKQAIRKLDLELRQRYFRVLAQRSSGVYLLLAGSALYVFAVNRNRGAKKELPELLAKAGASEEALQTATRARWMVAASGGVVGLLLFGLSLGFTSALPQRPAELERLLGSESAGPAVAASDAASLEELKQNWPRFRGFEGSGVSPFTNFPATWDVSTGAGIAWKVPSPTAGFNSPLIWGERVFLSGGDANQREVVCLDLKTGQLAWRQSVANVPGSPVPPPEIPESTGYAAATMATDGRRVYAIFANGDLVAFTLEGKPVWAKAFGALKNAYGHATSLATWNDKVLVQLDQGESEEGKSKLYALDGRTGQLVWQKPRKAGGSWASPIVFQAAGKPQIIALAVPHVIAYSAIDGAELWRVDCLNGEVTPSPVFSGGNVLVASPSEKLVAIRPDGQGDVTKTHVVWTAEDNVPDVTSPVSNGELVFAVTTPGMLTCFDAKDGKKQWEHDFEMECHSSPCIAGNRMYLFGQKGRVVVVETARQFKELFRTEMGDAFHASPAFASGRIVLRGEKNVWCVGK